MKKTYIIAVFILYATSVLSQISESFNYLPLKVGNTWVYGYTGSVPGKTRLKIISELNVNGHKYFVFDQQGDTCICSFYSYSPFLTRLAPMRVDSLTAKLMFQGTSCQWQIGEKLLDSLSIKIGDNPNNSCNAHACSDTSMQNIFGIQRKTKRIGMNIPNYYYFRTYAKDIGLVSSIMGCFIGTTCSYNLLGCVINGTVYGDTGFVTGINQISSEIPNEFSLFQNYPNPFNPSTNIKFQMPKSGFVKLTVYDLLGKEIQTLVNQQLSPGTYEVDFDGSNLPSGVYNYKLKAGVFTETKKMVLIK